MTTPSLHLPRLPRAAASAKADREFWSQSQDAVTELPDAARLGWAVALFPAAILLSGVLLKFF